MLSRLRLSATLVGFVIAASASASAADRYVSTSGSDVGDCSSAGAPCATIQYALDMAGGGDVIKVAQGTYPPVTAPPDLGSSRVQGGWTLDFSERAFDPGLTVLEGGGSGNVLDLVVCGNVSLVFENLTFTGGDTGVKCRLDWPCFTPALVRLESCLVTGNGEGIDLNNPGPYDDLHFELVNSMVVDNYGGGGLNAFADESVQMELTILNSTISGNTSADTHGAGITLSAWGSSSGYGHVNLFIINSIVWENRNGEDSDDLQLLDVGTHGGNLFTWIFVSSDIGAFEWWGIPQPITGPGTISADPVFSRYLSDFHLAPGSPCIDTGDDASAAGLTTDFEGDTRFFDGDGDGTATIDMGADEVVATSSWGLKGLWKADESANDASGFDNHGTLNGNMGFGAGLAGPGFAFDGIDNLASVPDDTSLDVGVGDFSIAFWMLSDPSTGCYKGLVDKRSTAPTTVGFSTFLANGMPGLQLADASDTSNYTCTNAQIDDGRFHRLAFSVDRDSPTGLAIFVDGKPACEFDPTPRNQALDNPAELRIGASHSAPDPCFFAGVLDEIWLWSRSVATDENADIFGSGRAWWPLDSDSQDVIADNDGVLLGGAVFTSSPEGGALFLDGSDDFMSVPDDPSLDLGLHDFSVSFWIQTRQSAGCYPSIVEKRDAAGGPGFSVYLADGRPGIQLGTAAGSQNFTSTAYVADGGFHSVVVTVDRSSDSGGKIFLDGHGVHTFDPKVIVGSLDSSSDLWVGSTAHSGPCYLHGTLDEVRIEGRVLSEQEVSFLARTPPAVIFLNGLETGSTVSWSSTVPLGTRPRSSPTPGSRRTN